jgi:hypothetical protein
MLTYVPLLGGTSAAGGITTEATGKDGNKVVSGPLGLALKKDPDELTLRCVCAVCCVYDKN